jgi:hypothetical protein
MLTVLSIQSATSRAIIAGGAIRAGHIQRSLGLRAASALSNKPTRKHKRERSLNESEQSKPEIHANNAHSPPMASRTSGRACHLEHIAGEPNRIGSQRGSSAGSHCSTWRWHRGSSRKSLQTKCQSNCVPLHSESVIETSG